MVQCHLNLSIFSSRPFHWYRMSYESSMPSISIWPIVLNVAGALSQCSPVTSASGTCFKDGLWTLFALKRLSRSRGTWTHILIPLEQDIESTRDDTAPSIDVDTQIRGTFQSSPSMTRILSNGRGSRVLPSKFSSDRWKSLNGLSKCRLLPMLSWRARPLQYSSSRFHVEPPYSSHSA